MKLHLTSDSIGIYVVENSSHYARIHHLLAHSLGRSFWVNETLINFEIAHENQKRKAFLTSLYYHCAFVSKTHNASFLEKLLLASRKPIKLLKIQHKNAPKHSNDAYTLLNAEASESLKSIRQKYLSLAKTFHPDSITLENTHSIKKATETFQKIQEAYAIIKAEKTRKIAA